MWCLQVPKTLTVQPVVVTLTLHSMNIHLFNQLKKDPLVGGHATTARLSKQNEKEQCFKKKTKTKATLDRNVYIFCWKNTATVKTWAAFSKWLTGVTYYSWWGCFSEHQEKDSPQEADLVSTSFTLWVSLRILLSVLSTRWARSSMISEKRPERSQRRLLVFEGTWLCTFCRSHTEWNCWFAHTVFNWQ